MTKPTRQQEQACNLLAEALFGVTEAARLDGRASLTADDLRALVALLIKATSAFPPDQVVARALERRVRHLGLPGTAVEMLTLMDADVPPLEMLRMADDDLRGLVARVEEELGEVG